MKNLYGTLLLIITILHNFGELNASDSREGTSWPHGGQHPHPYGSEYLDPPIPGLHPSGSQYPHPPAQLPHSSSSLYSDPPVQLPDSSGRQHPHPLAQLPHPSGSQHPNPPAQRPHPTGSQYLHEKDPNLDPPANTYACGDRVIGVWRIPNTKKVSDARLLGPNTIPDHLYKNSHVYVSRAEYLDGMRVILYTENEKVIGAELPPSTSGPTPSKSTCYIHYLREDFKVKVNPRTGAVLSVSLNVGNFSPPKSYRQQFPVETVPVFVGGIRFFVDVETLSNGHRKILGAFVNPRED